MRVALFLHLLQSKATAKMTSRILNSMGVNIGAVKRALGTDDATPGGTTNDSSDVIYVEISHADMLDFRHFYKKAETDVANANDIKDFYTLNENVEYSFAGEPIDEEKYAIRDPLNALQSEARAWHDMFGFVAVYNPDLRADYRVREMRAEANDESLRSGNAALANQVRSALDMPEFLLTEANLLIDDALPDNAEEARRAILGEDLMDESETKPSAKRTKREARPSGRIIPNPRHSSTRNPGAVLIIDSGERAAPGVGRNDDADDDISEIEYREKVAREQRQDTRRTLDETIIGLRSLRVVDVEDGRFFLEIDRASMSKRVVFVRANSGTPSPLNSVSKNNKILEATDYIGNGNAMTIDPNVFVYVWDNRMPFEDGQLNSKMYEVIRRRQALDQADRNAADVDLTNAHPVQVLKHIPTLNKLDVERMLDPQLYGRGATQTATETRETLRRDAVLDYQLKMVAAVQNNKRDDELARLMATNRLGSTVIDTNGNSVNPEFKRHGFFPLPSGFDTATTVKPELTVDVEMLVFRFRRALSNALGVPMTILDGGSSFSGRASKNSAGATTSGASESSQAIGDSRLRNTILADRGKVLRPFIGGLWDGMYRHIDNATLKLVLDKAAKSTRAESEVHIAEMRLIQKRLKTITDLAEESRLRSDLTTRRNEIESAVARLRDLSSRVRKIISMQYRFEVNYKSLAFVPLAELQAGTAAFALSKLEFANAMRANFGMKPMTEEEFKKLTEEELQDHVGKIEAEAQVQAKYAPKPAGAAGAKGGGGGGGKQLKLPSATALKTPAK
jgi:flagellin-like hook-associated protein FlgL